MKVALVSLEFPPFTFGGVASFCYDLAHALSRRKIPTTVFCGRSRKTVVERLNDYLEVVRLPCLDFPPRSLWFQIKNFISISKQLKDCALIHAISPEVSPICIYLKKKLDKPLVTSYHGVQRYICKDFINLPFSEWSLGDFAFHVLYYPLHEIPTRLSLNDSDHIISCSNTILKELVNIHENVRLKDCSVIYNGLNLDGFESIGNSSVKRENANDLELIYYGRLYGLKGISYLVKAFRFLIRDYPNLNLKIFGKGPLEHKIQALISDLDMKDKIHVLGQIPRTKLLAEIMKTDVVVLPSLREGQPISVLEAMACKKPVVVFDFPFVSEYIKDLYTGLLAKPRDPKNLASKIHILLSDEKLRHRLGNNAYKYVRQHHNWDNLVVKYIEVYRKVAHLS